MTVYIVTIGEYSDYDIDSVYLDKAKADLKVAALNAESIWNEAQIEVYETNDENLAGDPSKILYEYVYCADYDPATKKWELKATHGYEKYFEDAYKDKKPTLTLGKRRKSKTWQGIHHMEVVYLKEPNSEKAYKIACDRLAKLKAEVEIINGKWVDIV